MPKLEVAVHRPFFFRLAEDFDVVDLESSVFSQQGLAQGSGLLLDESSGVIAGIPNGVDLQMLQPILIEVLATDEFGNVEARILPLTITGGGGAQNDQRVKVSAQAIEDQSFGMQSFLEVSAAHRAKIFPFPFSFWFFCLALVSEIRSFQSEERLEQHATQGAPFYFSTVDASPERNTQSQWFEFEGLPSRSGLRGERRSGVLEGTPNAVDVAESPFLVSVVGHDYSGPVLRLSVLIEIAPLASCTPPLSFLFVIFLNE